MQLNKFGRVDFHIFDMVPFSTFSLVGMLTFSVKEILILNQILESFQSK